MKKIAQLILLLFVAGAVGYWAWGKVVPGETSVETTPPAPSAQAAAIQVASTQAKPTVVVTYFTTDVRCESCRPINARTASGRRAHLQSRIFPPQPVSPSIASGCSGMR